MNSITFTKAQCELIDLGIQIEFSRKGIAMYAVADPCGDFETPNGTKFFINYFAPSKYDLTVYFR